MKKKSFLLLFSAIPLLVWLSIVIALLSSPYLGLQFKKEDNSWRITSVDRSVHGDKLNYLIGKEVVSIAGRTLEEDDLIKDLDERKNKWNMKAVLEPLSYFNQNIKTGQKIDILIRNDSSIESISITPSSYPIEYYLEQSYILLILAFATLALSIIVIIKKPDDIRAAAFYMLAIVLSGQEISSTMYFARDLSFNYYVFNTIYYLGAIFGYASLYYLLYFSLVFPKPLPIASNKIYKASLFILPPAIVFFSSIMTLYVYPTFPITCLALSFAAIIYNYLTISSPELRAQIKTIFFGYGLVIITALSIYFIPLFFLNKTFVDSKILMLLSFAIPLSMAFAITKYKLMDIDTLFDNTLIYSVTIGLLVLIDFGIITLLAISKIPFLAEPIPTIIAVWMVIFTYIPVRNNVRDMVKRLLKREMYDINKVSVKLSEEFVSVNDENNAIKKAIDTIQNALHPKDTGICIYNEKGYVSLEDKILPYIQPKDLPDVLFMPEESVYKTIPSGSLIVPVRTSEVNIGYFVLHPKHSGRMYDSNDHKLIGIIANLAAATIERIRYREETYSQRLKAIAEKERLSREIHDGIGNSLVHAITLTRMIGKEKEEKRENINQLESILQEGLTDLRELIWTVESNEYPLSELIEYLHARIKFLNNYSDNLKCTVETNIDGTDNPNISYEMRVNIIRIVQEALANVLKYSMASNVFFSISHKEGIFSIEIKDNGQGFDSNKLKSGYGIRNMKKRAEKIGAEFDISSGSGEGTKISLSVRI
jgi:signal transduction histidine kinase